MKEEYQLKNGRGIQRSRWKFIIGNQCNVFFLAVLFSFCGAGKAFAGGWGGMWALPCGSTGSGVKRERCIKGGIGGSAADFPSSFSAETSVFLTELEFLWDRAKLFNFDLEVSRKNEKSAFNSRKYKGSLYPFSLTSSLSSSFSDVYEGLEWYSDSSSAEFSVSKKNPGGNTLKGGVNYSLNRGILNYFEPVDSSNIGYSQRPGISLNVSQSTLPFYFQGERRDPNVQLLNESLKLSELETNETEKAMIESLTLKYIQLRSYLRYIKKQQAFMAYYDERIQVTEEMLKKGQATLAEIWELENSKVNYFTDCISYENSRDELISSIKALAGWDTVLLADETIPLPECESVNLYENYEAFPEIQKIRVQQKMLELQNVLNRQNYAPAIMVSGSFSESLELKDSLLVNYAEDKSAFSWSFSVALSFDEFFSPARKLREETYMENGRLYEQKLSEVKEKLNSQRKNCSLLIESYRLQLEKAEKLRANREAVYKSYQELLKNGNGTLMDIKGLKVQLYEAEVVCENLKDMLWFYQWKKEFMEDGNEKIL